MRLKALSGSLPTDDILALPFGSAAYLDSRARVELAELPALSRGHSGAASPDLTLFLAGRPVCRARPVGELSRSSGTLLLELSRLLPWYSGLPYSLKDPRGGEYPITGCRPAESRPWYGRLTEDAPATPATPATGRAAGGPAPGAPTEIEVAGVLFPADAYERLAAKAVKAARREGGVPRGSVFKALSGLQNPIRAPFVESLVASGRLKDLGERLIENPPEKTLSPLSRGVLAELEKSGTAGVTLGERPKGFRDAAFRLEEMGLAVLVAGRLAWSAAGFAETAQLLRKRSGQAVTADHVAELLGCSKTLGKDLLRRLAEEGFVYSTTAAQARWRGSGGRRSAQQ